jgi:hypothetical protein
MIEVKEEPTEIRKAFPRQRDIEECIFCHIPTRYWYKDGEVPICQHCAFAKNETDIPEKHLKPKA